MRYYVSGLEREFYHRVIRASILFLFIGLLLGVCLGVYTTKIQTTFNNEKIQYELKQKRDKIADLETALGLLQGKNKVKVKVRAIK
jgi:hypothetical protein